VLPLPARELLRTDDSDTVYYQVLGTKGEYLSGEKDLPLPPEDERLPPGEVRMREVDFEGTDLQAWPYMWVRAGRCPTAGPPWCRWPKPWTSARCWPPKSSKA